MLLARLAGGFQAPMVKAAGLFQAFTRNMAYGIKALIDQRVEGGESLPADEPDGRRAAPSTGGRADAPAAEAADDRRRADGRRGDRADRAGRRRRPTRPTDAAD